MQMKDTPHLPPCTVGPRLDDNSVEQVCLNIPYNVFRNQIEQFYEEQAFFKRNLFKIPSGKAGKDFINEMTFWLRQFNIKSKLNKIALKVMMVLPTLLLQKPSQKSKAKQHTLSLERRITLWREGKISELEREVRHIQSKFKTNALKSHAENMTKRFSKFMSEGNISAALKLLESNSSAGVISLTE